MNEKNDDELYKHLSKYINFDESDVIFIQNFINKDDIYDSTISNKNKIIKFIKNINCINYNNIQKKIEKINNKKVEKMHNNIVLNKDIINIITTINFVYVKL